MKISSIALFNVELPLSRGSYTLSGGRKYRSLISSIVRVRTGDGLTGWGETCPFGPNYLAAFSGAVLPALDVMSPSLIGLDSTNLASINEAMDRALRGHEYIKSAVDIACADILGQKAGLPLFKLLGGRLVDVVPVMASLPTASGDENRKNIEVYRRQGFKQFNTHLGSFAKPDISQLIDVLNGLAEDEVMVVDGNGLWTPSEAITLAKKLEGCRYYMEQPCATTRECAEVRRKVSIPIMLDECVVALKDLGDAFVLGALDCLNLRVSRVGGLFKARVFRDLCSGLGLKIWVKDVAGSEIATAATMHLALASPATVLLGMWPVMDLTEKRIGPSPFLLKDGMMSVIDERPGLGVTPNPEVLGNPAAEWSK